MAAVTVRPVGPAARLAELPAEAPASDVLDLAEWLRGRLSASDVVPGARTVLVDGIDPALDLVALVEEWRPGDVVVSQRSVEVAVRYDGADLADLAERWGTDIDGVVERHTSIDFVVAFTGFAPGFPYLSGMPDEWAVPRLDSPRTRVPAGSVGLAGAWCGIYPTTSPGGWRLLGTTDHPLWDDQADPPATLPPGTRVRFVAR